MADLLKIMIVSQLNYWLGWFVGRWAAKHE